MTTSPPPNPHQPTPGQPFPAPWENGPRIDTLDPATLRTLAGELDTEADRWRRGHCRCGMHHIAIEMMTRLADDYRTRAIRAQLGITTSGGGGSA